MRRPVLEISMLLFLSAALLQIQIQTGPARCPGADSTEHAERCRRVTSIGVGGFGTGVTQRDGAPRRRPVTEQDRATAFRDPTARVLLARARDARSRQDSALLSYEATAYQRFTARLAVSRLGRERTLFSGESTARVRWQRGRGAWVEVLGARAAVPLAPADSLDEMDGVALGAPIPFVPGQEELFWVGATPARHEVDERDAVHPLADGAEAYYTYAAGDSAMFRLPDGSTVRILELQVRPRSAQWNLAVGSLWFDADRGTLVRAVYRFAAPLDFWANIEGIDSVAARTLREAIPGPMRTLASPIRGQIRATVLEYGLHEGRWWLPRHRYAEGEVQASFVRMPIRIEEGFRYSSVNGRDTIPEIPPLDGPDIDSLDATTRERHQDSLARARRARRDSAQRGLILPERAAHAQCDSSDSYVVARRVHEGSLPIATRVPCDRAALAASSELPWAVEERGEDPFGVRARDDLVADALGLGAQPAWAPQPPRLDFGFRQLRYNRVEGLSVGAALEQELGAGYTARTSTRIGLADRRPNGELSLQRSDLRRTLRLGAYERLSVTGDHGNPLSFGSSVSAVLSGRDEGYYFRATGVELAGTGEPLGDGPQLEWRLFAERQRSARVEAPFALGGRLDDANLAALEGRYAGGSLRLRHVLGAEPRAFRLLTDLRLEAAVGDSSHTIGYGRAALDLTASRHLGLVAGALTLGGGTSLGTLPAQRQWYLGGTHTVRGQRIGAATGDAFWLARAELGLDLPVVRPVLFGDIGWAGDRARLGSPGQPLSGIGIGASLLDGLLRFDVARGIQPGRSMRVALYLEGRF